MSRSSDLNSIAPDSIPASSTSIPPSNPTTPPSPPKISPDSPEFQQKIYDILGHTKHSLSSFLVRPDVFTFDEKDDHEEIILVLRPHWFTNVGWIALTILMLFVPAFLKYVPLLSGFSSNYQLVSIVFWYLVTFAFSFEKFLSWYFDIYIVTTERLIDIDFNNLLDKKFSEAGLEMIQDTTSEVSGVSQTVFNYGNVLIQTAAEINEIKFSRVPNPDKVIKIINELREAEISEHD